MKSSSLALNLVETNPNNFVFVYFRILIIMSPNINWEIIWKLGNYLETGYLKVNSYKKTSENQVEQMVVKFIK